MGDERIARLRAELEECERNITFLDGILAADDKRFKELYEAVEPGHVGQWGAEKALAIIHGKWCYPILMRLIRNKVMRYSEIKHELEDEGLTDYMLSKALKTLMANGLVEKKMYLEVPVRTEYMATERAFEYWRIVLELSRWYNKSRRDEIAIELDRASGPAGNETDNIQDK